MIEFRPRADRAADGLDRSTAAPVAAPGAAAAPVRPTGRRVLYVVSLFPCWSETFIVREIHELLRLGLDVRVLSLKHPSESLVQSDARQLLDRVLYPPRGWSLASGALREALGHPVVSARELWRLSRGLGRQPQAWIKSLVVWTRTLALLPTLRQLAPARLHAHWATYPSTAAMWASARLRVPFSFTAHAHDIFVADHLLAEKLRAAEFAVTISDFNRRYLAEHVTPLAREVMRVVHCGVAVSQFAFRPAGRRPRRVLSVGRLDPIKGFEDLIKACAILRGRAVDFDCHIVGDGPLEGRLRALIESHGLQDQVKLIGACPQAQVLEQLYAASVFVLASVVAADGNRDGIPVALMEAMACGAPVVSTRVSGIPELVEDGVCGLLAEPGDPSDLARCIEQQLHDADRARAMAVAARFRIETDFDAAREAGKLHAAMV
jgi:glycosyltransferase involved in cell wall biosynthesis